MAALASSLIGCAMGVQEPEDKDEGPSVDVRTCPAINKVAVAQQCGRLLEEPFFLTLIDQAQGLPNEIALLGANSGDTCTVQRFSAANPVDHVVSLAAIGTDVFYCATTVADAAGNLTRVSLLDGKVTTSGVRCLATTAFDDKLLVIDDVSSTVWQYDNFEAVLTGAASTMMIGELAIRLGSGDEKIYSTAPTPTAVNVFDPATHTSVSIALPPSAITVTGIAVKDGTIALLDGTQYNQFMHKFDASTGSSLGKIVAASQVARVHGLTNGCSVPVLE